MNTNLRRGVVALAAALASLALMGSSPVSAATATADITSGTVSLINSTVTVTDTITLGPGVTTLGTGCANSIVVTSTTTTGTSVTHWQVTAFSTIGRFKLGTNWYIAELSGSSTSGTVSSVTTTSATLNSATISLSATIYAATDNTDTGTSCAHSDTRTCRFNNVSASLQGTYSGNIHTPATSDTATLNGTGTLGTTSPPCVAPFATHNGGMVTIANLVAHVL